MSDDEDPMPGYATRLFARSADDDTPTGPPDPTPAVDACDFVRRLFGNHPTASHTEENA